MKKRNWCLFIAFTFLFVSCNTNEKEKKNENKLVDSPVNSETPLTSKTIEKEFKEVTDSVSKNKPVKDSVLLKFNFQKGKTYNYAMIFDIAQNKGGQSGGSTMKWNYDMKAIDVKKNLTTLETTYGRIDMAVNMGNGMKMEFSSEKEVDTTDFMQIPSRMFHTIKGKSFMMQVDEKGEVKSVSGFDKIGEAVISETKLPEGMKPMLHQNFQRQFNDDAVKQMFSQSFNIFPNKYVKVGDNWTTNTTLAALKQDITTVYTVKSIRGNHVLLTGVSKLKSTDGKNSGTQTSRLIIDAKTGLMIDGVFDQKSNDGGMSTKSRITGKEI
jgi:hypothetical protein